MRCSPTVGSGVRNAVTADMAGPDSAVRAEAGVTAGASRGARRSAASAASKSAWKRASMSSALGAASSWLPKPRTGADADPERCDAVLPRPTIVEKSPTRTLRGEITTRKVINVRRAAGKSRCKNRAEMGAESGETRKRVFAYP